MLHTGRLSIRGNALTLTFVLLFLFLANFSGSAAARPLHLDAAVSVTNKAHASPAAAPKGTVWADIHTQAIRSANSESLVTFRIVKNGGKNTDFSVSLDFFSQHFSWIKTALKAFLVSVWTSIHTHASGVVGGHCS